MPVEGTPAEILARLRDGPRQAQDLAEALGIDRSAVRRHLENLRDDGLVETADVIEGPGRPKKMYSLTLAGRETFPRDYPLLVELLLSKLEGEHGRPELERLISLIAQELGESVQGKSTAARLDAMLALYNRLGFEADVERVGRETVCLRQRNCIFLKAARADPALMCQCLDEGIMGAALPGAKIVLEASLAHGDTHCRHVIHLGRTNS